MSSEGDDGLFSTGSASEPEREEPYWFNEFLGDEFELIDTTLLHDIMSMINLSFILPSMLAGIHAVVS
jgi:hypothetical protein